MRLNAVELRQYAMRPGRRDELITLFEREFVETQAAAGIHLIGLFKDIDRPDRFVWLRGYPELSKRKPALEAFYNSDHWFAHRAATNATLISSDDVLLLRPLTPGWAPETDPVSRVRDRVIVAGVHRLEGPDDPLVEAFERTSAAALSGAGLTLEAVMITDPSPNGFPRHPVRQDEWVLVWLSHQLDLASADTALARARADPQLKALFAREMQILRLSPTARSPL